MSVVITILSVIAGIIALILIIALFTKKDFALEKQIVINNQKAEVFDFLKLIKNQEQYSVWVMKDPNIKLTYTGVDGTPGFTAAWESNDKNVGVGEQEIIQINQNESMQVEVRFKKPFEGTNIATTTVTAIDETQTKVSSIFTGRSKFPMNIMNLMMEKLVGTAMQQTLENAKAVIEKQ